MNVIQYHAGDKALHVSSHGDKGQAMFIYPREHHYQAVYLQQDMVLVQMAAMQEAEQQDVELFLLMPNDEQ
ncbi:TPA: hypothetical protein ACH3X2_002541 [Trebouxia sp. C0005]